AVWHWRQAFAGLRPRSARRAAVELGLGGVVATQLWHHIFVDGSLADLPSLAAPARTEKERAACHGTNAERSVLLPLSPLPSNAHGVRRAEHDWGDTGFPDFPRMLRCWRHRNLAACPLGAIYSPEGPGVPGTRGRTAEGRVRGAHRECAFQSGS